jgi:hypothetical protein
MLLNAKHASLCLHTAGAPWLLRKQKQNAGMLRRQLGGRLNERRSRRWRCRGWEDAARGDRRGGRVGGEGGEGGKMIDVEAAGTGGGRDG